MGPLGLEDSLLDRAAARQRRHTDGHIAMPINGQPALAVQTPLWVSRCLDPAGGTWATTRDVIRYGRFHLAAGMATAGANVVNPDSLLRMREPAMPIPGFPLRFQMGRDWFVQDVEKTRVFFQLGDTLGARTEFCAIPARRFLLVVLPNGQLGGAAGRAAPETALAQFPALAPLRDGRRPMQRTIHGRGATRGAWTSEGKRGIAWCIRSGVRPIPAGPCSAG